MKTAISLANSSLEDDKHNLTRYISERGESRLSEEDKDEEKLIKTSAQPSPIRSEFYENKQKQIV